MKLLFTEIGKTVDLEGKSGIEYLPDCLIFFLDMWREMLRRQLIKSGARRRVWLEVWDPSVQRQYLIKNNISCVKAAAGSQCPSSGCDQTRLASCGHPLTVQGTPKQIRERERESVSYTWSFIFQHVFCWLEVLTCSLCLMSWVCAVVPDTSKPWGWLASVPHSDISGLPFFSSNNGMITIQLCTKNPHTWNCSCDHMSRSQGTPGDMLKPLGRVILSY